MRWYGYEQGKLYSDSRFVGLNGKPIERTPLSYPYNYDEYVIWKDENFNEEECSAVYSDRFFNGIMKNTINAVRKYLKIKGNNFMKESQKKLKNFLVCILKSKLS